jgi:hypothetical protein
MREKTTTLLARRRLGQDLFPAAGRRTAQRLVASSFLVLIPFFRPSRAVGAHEPEHVIGPLLGAKKFRAGVVSGSPPIVF